MCWSKLEAYTGILASIEGGEVDSSAAAVEEPPAAFAAAAAATDAKLRR